MTKPATILVADDHEPTVSGLGELLQRAHYDIWTTTSGRAAVQLAMERLPDAILLDVGMPDLSGLEVCAQLKAHAATRLIPIVLMSGSHERDRRIAGLAAGADDFLAKPVDSEELAARVRSLVRVKRLTDELESAEALFLTLGRIVEARDSSTHGHCERLAAYATALGTSCGLDGADLIVLRRGAFLHDIGKIAIPDRVLLKRSRLTTREYALIKTHPVVGDELCRTVRSLDAVRAIVRHHHERLDGRGYPDGLAGDEIPLVAQIVTIVDVFDALTTKRPYRKALSTAAAVATMRLEARQGAYAPALVEQFVGLIPSRAVPRPAWPPPPVRNRIAKFPVRRQPKAAKSVRVRSARVAIA
jgi:putative two-component system response regulator